MAISDQRSAKDASVTERFPLPYTSLLTANIGDFDGNM